MPRANWKGFLKVGELTCPVALYTAASTSDRVAFHIISKSTQHRLRRRFVDRVTGEPVDDEAQVKGYEIGKDEYVVIEAGEIASALPAADKTLAVEAFLHIDDIDDVYLDRPYYLAPADQTDGQAYAILSHGMRDRRVAALARTVLFRRMRNILIRPGQRGLIATTLHYNYEVRAAKQAFGSLKEVNVEGEMLDLAKHIIAGKSGAFDPAAFKDRYEDALAELVKAKLAGREFKARTPAAAGAKVISLLDALKKSAEATPGAESKPRPDAASAATSARGKTASAPKAAKVAARRKKAG